MHDQAATGLLYDDPELIQRLVRQVCFRNCIRQLGDYVPRQEGRIRVTKGGLNGLTKPPKKSHSLTLRQHEDDHVSSEIWGLRQA